MREAQDPLTYWHVGQDVIDQMRRRPLRHAPAAAARAKAAPLARERDESIDAAGGAPKTSEAAGQAAAPEEFAKLLLDELRQPIAIPQRGGLSAEGLEMLPDDPVEDRRSGNRPVHRWSMEAPRAVERRPSCHRARP